MAATKLNKILYNQICRLKSLNATSSTPKFVLEQSPFVDEDDEAAAATASSSEKEILIIGRIFPDSEIYREGAFKIEMKLTDNYPFDPPEVRFLTPIYHPNVEKDGKFCIEILKKTGQWKSTSTLIEVVTAVVKHIDQPNIDYSESVELGREYKDNRPEFNRKALEYVKKHALSRQ
ncbi:unnamed protein product [Rotaria sp. Silwood1]|nr:unnamed protein product [Rotaria sp. Silwood1]CAF1136719.1 unnamed protein product [Rotaria sp. Silwood1]CAF1140750.1 unnamed protein product [Rotaria sp. Silwood1]CAF3448888.1 unnamed protein product [Rotaria sp. Silwood1]CAF3453530.1 unnamed protein product [Rotaria sp. Silwood1]